MPADDAPAPLTARVESSFAYTTMKTRLPVIIVKTMDFFCRHKRDLQTFGGVAEGAPAEELEEDAKQMISACTRLRKIVETNKSAHLLEKFDLDKDLEYFNDDIEMWNKSLIENKFPDGSMPRFFESPWLLMECYLYRKLKESMLSTKHLKAFDPFVEQKRACLAASLPQMVVIAKHLLEVEDECRKSPKNMIREEEKEYNIFMHLALWANKSDLSISGMSADKVKMDNKKTFPELCESIEALKSNILINNLHPALYKLHMAMEQVRAAKEGDGPFYLDLVADNAGYELFVDLCLLHFITVLICGADKPRPFKVRIHLKRMPWFVSDAMKIDVEYLLTYLGQSDKDQSLKSLSEKWQGFFKSGTWVMEDHKFWTSPYEFIRMPDVAPELYAELKESILTIFKGDLNYRKLVGDRHWEILEPFRAALRSFEPGPLISLRTSKADVVVGIEDPRVYERIQKKELPKDWQISGNYAMISYIEPFAKKRK